jgi:hypothetical protein
MHFHRIIANLQSDCLPAAGVCAYAISKICAYLLLCSTRYLKRLATRTNDFGSQTRQKPPRLNLVHANSTLHTRTFCSAESLLQVTSVNESGCREAEVEKTKIANGNHLLFFCPQDQTNLINFFSNSATLLTRALAITITRRPH